MKGRVALFRDCVNICPSAEQFTDDVAVTLLTGQVECVQAVLK